MLSISIIVPVYNEENTLMSILKNINNIKRMGDIEIILINDGSTDKTKQLIDENKNLYDVSKHLEKNQGKGRAIIEGLKISSKEYIFFQDADLEYDPEDLSSFIEIIKKHNADLIMGSRFTGNIRSVLHFWHMLGNQFITKVFNLFNNTTFTDIYCCQCLFKKKNLPINKLKCFGWGQQAEILSYLSKNSKKIYETSVSYNGRKYDEGKKIRYYDIFGILYQIIITKFKT